MCMPVAYSTWVFFVLSERKHSHNTDCKEGWGRSGGGIQTFNLSIPVPVSLVYHSAMPPVCREHGRYWSCEQQRLTTGSPVWSSAGGNQDRGQRPGLRLWDRARYWHPPCTQEVHSSEVQVLSLKLQVYALTSGQRSCQSVSVVDLLIGRLGSLSCLVGP